MQCEIAEKFFEMLNAVTAARNVPWQARDGQLLYRAEIDLLRKIEAYPMANVSELSAKCGTSKSAVTQMCARLQEKGWIEPLRSETNKKEKYFCLTPSGKSLRTEHEAYYEATADRLCRFLQSLKADEKRMLFQFMEMMQQCAPVYAFPCRCGEGADVCDETEPLGE